MDFRLECTPKPFTSKITHQHKIMLVGSCFTENIGEKLAAHKFTVLQNPNGILFNPVSVNDAFENYTGNKKITENNLFQLNESFHSWQHHSRFSGITANESVNKINASTEEAHLFLKEADWLIITFGSAWVYELTEKAANAKLGAVAANNHKAPADWFNRRLLSNNETEEVITQTVKQLQQFNSSIKIIFTISPVRHIREGFVENNQSKARLISAVHAACAGFKNVCYFPAYELVIDDLRDYRFYAEDMVHPNYQATNYVWEKFTEAVMSEETKQLMAEINELNAAMNHRPFNNNSNAHRQFKEKYRNKANTVQQNNPFLNLSEIISFFS